MSKNDGGPAFPFGQTDDQSGQLVNGWGSEGMTLRDYFAAKALQGMLANVDWVDRMATRLGIEPDICASKAAYELADAMLAARTAKPYLRQENSMSKQEWESVESDFDTYYVRENSARREGSYMVERVIAELIQSAANAKLIAAAPELLDATERLLNNFKLLLSGKPVRDASETIAEAESAMAKATA